MAMKDPFELIQYLNSIGQVFREQNREIVLQNCPYCESNKKGNFAHFYFSKEKQTFFCHKCGVKGNLYRFKLDRGDIQPITRARNIEYKRPNNPDLFKRTETAFLDWYEKTRGISRTVLRSYEIGYTTKEIEGKKLDIIVYHYYNEKKELINRKFRSTDKKHMWTEKDAEKIYYGLQFLDFEKEYLHIVEGEDDCHALVQLGVDNVVSVPYGAGNYTPAMDRINKQFKKLILIFDNDERGQQGARQFAEKAGLTKCVNVILPFKDARDCLLEGIDIFGIQTEIAKAKPFRHEEIIKIGDAKEDFKNFIFHSQKLIGKMTPSSAFNKILGGVRLSELTIITGHTGSGKTTFANNLVAWMEQCGMIPMVMAFENKFVSIIRKFIEIYSHENIYIYDELQNKQIVSKDEKWVEKWINILNDKNLYFLNKSVNNKGGYFDLKHIHNIIDYAVKFYNVNLFLIDHLNYFLKLSNAKNPVHVIDETVRQIKLWTDAYNIHIILIVHPHMTQDKATGKTVELGLNSLKGSSSIAQECDNFLVVSRPEKKEGKEILKCKVLVKKNREHGKLGDFYLDVLENRNTFVPEGKKSDVKPDAEQESFYDKW